MASWGPLSVPSKMGLRAGGLCLGLSGPECVLTPSLCPAPNTETEPLLTWKKAQETVPWNIILLLGGGFAMAKGCEVRPPGSPNQQEQWEARVGGSQCWLQHQDQSR